jgi:hypothetical protein
LEENNPSDNHLNIYQNPASAKITIETPPKVTLPSLTSTVSNSCNRKSSNHPPRLMSAHCQTVFMW